MDIKGLFLVTVMVIILFLVLRYIFGAFPKYVYVPEYRPSGPTPSSACQNCQNCGIVGASSYCCGLPKKTGYKHVCIPNVSRHKCSRFDNQTNNYTYVWCPGAPRPRN